MLVSDGQATFKTSGQDTRGPIEKVFCSWDNVAWGASGNIGIIQRVHLALSTLGRSNFSNKSIARCRTEIAEKVSKAIKDLYQSQLLVLPGQPQPAVEFLFCGYVNDGPLILELSTDLTDTDHTARGYSAIGSGDIFPYVAMTTLRHFDVTNRTLEEAKILAYRVVDDAIKVAAYGLGPPICMAVVTKPLTGEVAVAKLLSDDELLELSHKVDEWKLLEAESLGRFVGLTLPPEVGPAENRGE